VEHELPDAQRQEMVDHFMREDPEWTRDFVSRMVTKVLEKRRKREREGVA